MSKITLNTLAYSKIMLHSAKYPYCTINGVLLANTPEDGGDLEIVDAIPLFHHSHYVTPMAEVALTQIESIALAENMVIAGYYVASENIKHVTRDECHGQKIADKIAENFPNALFVVVNNVPLKKEISDLCSELVVYQHSPSVGTWISKNIDEVINSKEKDMLATIISELISQGVQKTLVDFDNHLDCLNNDWSNAGIKKLVATMTAAAEK